MEGHPSLRTKGHGGRPSSPFCSARTASGAQREDSKSSALTQNIMTLLAERGVVLGLLDLSSGDDVKTIALGNVFHAEPQQVLKFFFEECKEGNLRRYILHDYENTSNDGNSDDGDKGQILYWQHFQPGGFKFIEYLIKANVSESIPNSSYRSVTFSSISDRELPNHAKQKMSAILKASRNTEIQRGTIEVEMVITGFEFGQSAVSFVGSIRAEKVR